MNLQDFSTSGRNIIFHAKQIAISNSNEKLEPLHIGLALLQNKDPELSEVCEATNINFNKLKSHFFKDLTELPKSNILRKIIYTKDTEELLENAIKNKNLLKEEQVSSTHLLISLCQIKDEKLLTYFADCNLQSSAIIEFLQSKKFTTTSSEKFYSAKTTQKKQQAKVNFIEEYCINLIDKAKDDKIDPVIGRDGELRRLTQILLRRIKNNPLLIGQPGVGKTAIVEALAKRIFEGDVPEKLKSVSLLELDLGKMLAGTKFRGDFEQRIKGVMQAITSIKTGAILFIDEIHTIVGAGSSEGGLDASNLLKPALARGELHCIGATTIKEYKKKIEPATAFARRFQIINVDEPDLQSCIGILRIVKEKYELYHGIRIKDEAIVAASELADRYINDRFLPDKAIDLIDEAAAKIQIETDSMPVKIDLADRKIMQLEIEKTALTKEKDASSKKRLAEINSEITEKKESRDKFKQQWLTEKEIIDRRRQLKTEIEKKKKTEIEAQKQGNLELAATIRYGELSQMGKELLQINKKIDSYGEQRLLKEEVAKEEICNIISQATGIPLEKMLLSEKEKLLKLEQHLGKRVIGQEVAINAVANSVRRARTYVDDPRKPSGSFFFFGPTGVGKTELVKALADTLFNDEQVIIRLDMSEYMEKHTISRLIGAPPGYVGYEEGGLLTEAVQRNPYSIILFDEIEKGHSDVFNVLLQILDEGTLTDSKGMKVSFKNSIIVLTSNFGSQTFFEENKKLTSEISREILLQKFKPELLNRIDEIIPFHPLGKDNIAKIIDIHFQNVRKNLLSQNIEINITKEALQHLAQLGFDKEFGARPLRRTVQKELLDIIAYKIIDDTIKENDKIEVRYVDNHLTLHRIR